jgi:hypothetical protein
LFGGRYEVHWLSRQTEHPVADDIALNL